MQGMSEALLNSGACAQGIMFRLLQGNPPLNMAKEAGFDLVFFDLEHGAYSYETLSSMCSHARALGIMPLVRVPELARAHVSRALDCGARGVMVPMLETPEQARLLVEWAKYPPLGKRGLSSNGGHSDYRKIGNPREFMAGVNERTLAIAQIETEDAIRHCEEVARIPGIDALVIGPNDLSVSLGYPGELEHPEMDAAIRRTADMCARHGKIFGMHAGAALLRKWGPHGLRLIVNSLDTEAIAQGFAQIRAANQSILEECK